MHEFPHLFQPLKIGNFEVPNRILNAKHGNRLTGDRELRYLQERARGGAGLIGIVPAPGGTMNFNVGAGEYDSRWGTEFDVVPIDPTTPAGIEYYDRGIPVLRKRVQVIHDEGAKVYTQILNSGAAQHRVSMQPAIAPSTVPDLYDMAIPHEMTDEEIERFVITFAHEVRRSKEAGLDAVELHGAHGYLLQQFFSPKFNRRTDRWGGSRENRLRIAMAIIAASRKLVGPDYPIGIRVGMDSDGAHAGLTVPELVELCRLLAPHVAFINVSGGSYTGLGDGLGQAYLSPWYERAMPNVAAAAAVKKAVGALPVFTAHKITDPYMAERIIAEGSADMAGMVRALIADPEFPRKAKASRVEDIRHCVGLNECHYVGAERHIMCAVNPAAGREAEMEIVAATTPRRVLVVGAGPAGMEAARSAALRGHQVMLMDRGPALGGTVRILALDPNRAILGELPRYMARELARAKVDVHLGLEVSVETVLKIAPDAVLVATGGVAHLPEVPGIRGENVVTGIEVLGGEAMVGQRVLVVGEMDKHIAAATLADFLSDQGKSVEVISEQVDFAIGAEHPTRYMLISRLLNKGVTITTLTRLLKAEPRGATVLNTFTRKERRIDVDSIVIAAGCRADDTLAKALRGKVKQMQLIGDCLAPRRIVHATLDGARAGRAV